MKPNIDHISQEPLSRMFIGMHTELNPTNELWYETGNFLQGVSVRGRKLKQKDGKLRLRTKNMGLNIEGNAEPAENSVAEYRFYASVMNGLRNVAFLCGDQLWLFRLRSLGGNQWQDNRISIVTDPGYGGQMQKSFAEFAGWVSEVEIIQVKDLQLKGAKLTYKNLSAVLFSTMPDSTFQIT